MLALASVCDGVSAERDGIACKVAFIDGMGNTLMIKVLTKKADSAERVAAAKGATRRVIDSFLLQGGVFIRMRTTRPDGAEVERTCSKVKGRKTEHCGEWAPAVG
ncbi:MAG: hypothetical protein A3H93_09140 [Rhodocyclales bacterium RIFCSPLOWO2_02_FULL_63_24]|nr:MAG: hypothetical protein A3H93_09140 [Rhodocyclales bacterium RIFCSPLOWO2_02_FULL_63_24]